MRSWIVLIITLILISNSAAEIPGCDYFDTVKLAESNKFPNGSYSYENLIIPPHLIAIYDHEILEDGRIVHVPKHLRGCACKLGTCIKFCCHKNLMLVDDERKCSGDISTDLQYDQFVNITLNNGTEVRRHVLNDLIVQQDLPVPCSKHYQLDEQNEWKLFENGALLRVLDSKSLSKREYCLQPHLIKDQNDDKVLKLVPHNCLDPHPSKWGHILVKMSSVILLTVTICVYLRISELRNLRGYCFVCYMICIIVHFSLLINDSLIKKWSKFVCHLNGYFGYFALISELLWITVISFDLWNSFGKFSNKHRFLPFALYAWGTAAYLTTIIIIIDSTLDSTKKENLPFLPGVGLYSCWIKTNDLSAIFYYHGPMAIQVIFNLTMFNLAGNRIVELKKDLGSMSEEHKKQFQSDEMRHQMFSNLFTGTVLMWFFEILAYMEQQNNSVMYKIFDNVNYAHGIIIFVFFVLKRSVLKLIWDRIRGKKSTDDEDAHNNDTAMREISGIDKNLS